MALTQQFAAQIPMRIDKWAEQEQNVQRMKIFNSGMNSWVFTHHVVGFVTLAATVVNWNLQLFQDVDDIVCQMSCVMSLH